MRLLPGVYGYLSRLKRSAAEVHPGLPDDADAWERIVKQAGLRGAVGQLAQQAVLRSREGSLRVSIEAEAVCGLSTRGTVP